MSDYQGNIIIKNPATPTGPAENGSAPGVWKLSEVLPFVRQGIWPTQGVQGADTYFSYVSLLLSSTSLGNANNNLFVDSSGAFNPISRNGNTTQGSATPYSANWSNYFDGSGDYLSVPDNTALNLAGGTFTLEAWIFPSGDYSNYRTIISKRILGGPSASYQMYLRITTGYLSFYNGSTEYVSSAVPTANAWNHVAAVYDGTNINLYLNGTRVLQTAVTITNVSASIYIGSFPTYDETVIGYLSNVRILKGVQAYTGASYTVPTAPLTAISGTSLLTCQSNRFRDASTNNFTITPSGGVRVTDFAPFSPGSPGITYNQSDITNWSGWFNGGTDRVQVPVTSNMYLGTTYTIEAWAYYNSTSYGARPIFSECEPFQGGFAGLTLTLNTSGNLVAEYRPATSGTVTTITGPTVTPYTWFHIALVSDNSSAKLYVNGTQVGSTTTFGDYPSAKTAFVAVGSWGHGWNDGGIPAAAWIGYISNMRVVKGVAVYTSNFTPPTTPLTAISGTVLLTCQNAAFTDNSTVNNILTPVSNATVTGNSPFNPTGYWSLSGTSAQGATIPQTTATDLGAGSFTIECWVYAQAFNSFVTKRRTDTALTGSWMLSADASGYFYFLGVGWASTYAATTNPIPLNKWTHVAVSRSGTNLSMYVNGVRVYNVTDSYNYTCSTYTIIKLGGNEGGNYPSGNALKYGLTGSISNLRIVQGTAVYDPSLTTLTVPTGPLTAISGTSLLTCQDATMKDNSTNNTNISLYSGAAIQPFNPFYTSTIASNGGSMYFDGNSDYLTSPSSPLNTIGTGDFTYEMWVYPLAIATYPDANFMVDNRNQINFALYLASGAFWFYNGAAEYSGGTVPTNAWSHVAVTRSSGTTRGFVNGVQAFSASDSTNYGQMGQFIGARYTGSTQFFNGYMSGLRFTNGTALYTSAFTPPTAPVTPSANTTLLLNGMNAGIYDATAINDMETVGNAQVSTAVSKFGGSSVYFDGSGDYLTSNASSDLYAFGTGNFTIEMWFNLSSFSSLQILYDSRPTSTDGLYPLIYVASGGGSVVWQISATAQITGTATLSTGVWYHLAVSRSSGSTRMFLNGTQIGSTYADTNAYLNSGTTRPFIGGSSYSAGTLTVNGYIEEVRVTKGVARYTANFTPPTQAFPTF